MKNRFTTFDLQSILFELRSKIVGLRVLNIYDVDKKTYLIRFISQNQKFMLLIESGIRLHLTEFDWPKNMMPSGFAMKLRKHLRQKKLEAIDMMGYDRVVDLKFGIQDSVYHIIIELYDRGNIILTDFEGKILSLLRHKLIDDTTKYVVGECYPFHHITLQQNMLILSECYKKIYNYPKILYEKFEQEKTNMAPQQNTSQKSTANKPNHQINTNIHNLNLKKLITTVLSFLPYGQNLMEHCLITNNLDPNEKFVIEISNEKFEESIQRYNSRLDGLSEKLIKTLNLAYQTFTNAGKEPNQGYLYYKITSQIIDSQPNSNELVIYEDFEPYYFAQDTLKFGKLEPNLEGSVVHGITDQTKCVKIFESFNSCVDEFYSKIEAQKLDQKVEQQEKTALKKLEHVKQDHTNRKLNLQKDQEQSQEKAELIELNLQLVDKAMKIIQSGIAAQMKWDELKDYLKEAQKLGDPVATKIKELKLASNQMIMLLSDPFNETGSEIENEVNDKGNIPHRGTQEVCIDLSLGSAYENAMSYYDTKKKASMKEIKTIESSGKALKSAQRKTNQLLKDFKLQMNINKTRKIYWFEKFYWFLSSENYLVIAGRDQQQNEILVKRYLKNGDLYVHADIHGASSLIIKNTYAENPIPPKTLNEAGVMALCYSSAWEAKITVGVWWVYNDQVSKTAPTGEYLTTGSFMIRGKKNYLPPLTMIMGYGVLFKLDEESTENHTKLKRAKSNLNNDLNNFDADPENQESEHELEMSGDESNKSKDETDAESNGEMDSDVDDDESAFPDTRIDDIKGETKIEEIILHTTNLNVRPKKITLQKAKRRGQSNALEDAAADASNVNKIVDSETTNASQPLKRGQKHKLKKIKEKYKDQDDEERTIKMQSLASAPENNKMTKSRIKALKHDSKHSSSAQESKSGNKTTLFDQIKYIDNTNESETIVSTGSSLGINVQANALHRAESDAEAGDLEEDNEQSDQLCDLLDSFTGNPLYNYNNNSNNTNPLSTAVVEGGEVELLNDAVLYALPVCAPYSALSNYRYKVKMIPGFTKRGKAGKAALNYFVGFAATCANAYAKSLSGPAHGPKEICAMAKHPLRLKDESNPYLLERALIKAIKDNDLSRNLPSKLKIYIPATNAAGTKNQL